MNKYLLFTSFLFFVSVCAGIKPQRPQRIHFFGDSETYDYLGTETAIALPSKINEGNFTFTFPEVCSIQIITKNI